MTLGPGSRIGPYDILTKLGEGGMGQVYRARDTRLKRDVAIKVLPASIAADRDRVARFQREAELLASLNHPHIAAIYGLEVGQAGQAEATTSVTCLVMELVEGEDLAQRIARGPMSLEEAVPVAKQIAEALEAAHEQGIVHRDLKPANIRLRHDGVVKVLDFGLAKAMDQAQGSGLTAQDNSPTLTSPAMTHAGMILGTAAYMSPEQARGRPVDKRTDVWAFGAVLYEMLTGHRAFAGDDVSEVLASVLAREPDWTRLPPGVPPLVVTFLKRCLQKDRQQRVRDIGDISLALSGAFDTAAPVAQPAAAIARPFSRRALPVAMAAVATALVAATAAWSIWPTTPAPPLTTRFEHVIPDDQGVGTTTQRPVIALSGDGQAFVYQTRRGFQSRSMRELASRVVTSDTAAEPFLSPDGQWVAYFGVGPRSAQLKKVPIGGGSPVVVCDVAANFPNGVSWAADDTILFAQTQGIFRVPASGGTPELIVKAGEGETIYGPRLLPSGNALLFSVTTDSGANRWRLARVVVQPLSSATRTIVVDGGSDAEYLPTGHLIYALGNTLYGARFDPDHPAPIRGAVPLVEGIDRPVGNNAAGSNYAVANDGTLIYLTGGTPRRSLVWVNRDGSGDEPIAAIPPGSFEDPRLSPDGTRVLVTRDSDIWVYDVASGRSSRVTRDGTSNYGTWDPTGTQIAYTSSAGGGVEAWVAPADGSGSPRQLTKLGGAVHVDSWSPDGKRLAIHQHSSTKVEILLLTVGDAAATPQPFAAGTSPAEGLRFSPDMGHAVFLSAEAGQREVYIRPYPGPGGQVTVSAGGGQEPVWVARTGEVFYRSLPLSGNKMFAASVATNPKLSVNAPVMLFDRSYFFAPSGSPRPQYDVTADGKRFLMVSTGAASGAGLRIVVVQHWFEELKRLVPAN